MIRIMKYPGAKGSLISEIRTLFYASGANLFVDVFGGSGVVSLNVCSPAVLYNDLDPRLYNLFMALAKYPDEIYRNLYEKYSDLAGKLSRKGNVTKMVKATSSETETRNNSNGSNRYASNLTDYVEEATNLIIEHTFSFGGMGTTYATSEKSPLRYLEKTLRQFREITERVQKWKIECLDFRDLIIRYDSQNSFFYIDPPYLGKKWYASNLTEEDYNELLELVRTIKGKYLITIDMEDSSAISTVGKPMFVFQTTSPGRKNLGSRKFAFYSNVINGRLRTRFKN